LNRSRNKTTRPRQTPRQKKDSQRAYAALCQWRPPAIFEMSPPGPIPTTKIQSQKIVPPTRAALNQLIPKERGMRRSQFFRRATIPTVRVLAYAISLNVPGKSMAGEIIQLAS